MSLFRNIMLAGIGLASLTKEKIEEIVEEAIKRGEVASADKAKLIEEIQQRAQAGVAEIRRLVDEQMEAIIRRLRLPEEIKKIQDEVSDLKARLERIEQEYGKGR